VERPKNTTQIQTLATALLDTELLEAMLVLSALSTLTLLEVLQVLLLLNAQHALAAKFPLLVQKRAEPARLAKRRLVMSAAVAQLVMNLVLSVPIHTQRVYLAVLVTTTPAAVELLNLTLARFVVTVRKLMLERQHAPIAQLERILFGLVFLCVFLLTIPLRARRAAMEVSLWQVKASASFVLVALKRMQLKLVVRSVLRELSVILLQMEVA
jgi:hypothetical protein